MNIKQNIMQIFEKFPHEVFTPASLAKRMYIFDMFVPYDNDVHIRQLYAKKKIDRVERGQYILNHDND